MDPVAAALQRFVAERPRLDQAGADVAAILRDALGRAGIAARVSHRVKDVDSYRAKVQLKCYNDPWADVTDKVGVRALVDRAGDVDAVHSVIRDQSLFHVHDTTDKRTQLGLDELGYSGLHLDIHAPAVVGDFEPIPVELQIRTIAQDAWSVVSHKLLYKPQTAELDPEDKRAIMRLVALVEVFDEEVERVMGKQARPVSTADGGPVRNLADVVRAQYSRFEANEGHPPLTQTVLNVLAATLTPDGVSNYQETLAAFVDNHLETLPQLLNDYGHRSQLTTSSDYVLWSQPESIALLENLEARPHRLLNEWREAGLPDSWLRPLAAHTDADLDI